MKLAVEKFSSILCIGFTASSSVEEDLCSEMRQYKDLEYDPIFDSVQIFGLRYSKEFTEVIGKIFMSDFKSGFASKSKFMCFVLSRCKVLSKTPSFFSFILICIFIHKIVSDIFRFLETECFTVANMASKCLTAAFYRHYVNLFEKENGFEGLVDYCVKLNETVLYSSDDSETESEHSSAGVDVYTFPNNDEIIDIIYSLKEIGGVDILLTEFEKNLLYEHDSSVDVGSLEDIFIPLDGHSQLNTMKGWDVAMLNLNIKSKHILEHFDELCPLCKDICYKHVVHAAKELEVGDL